jgi:hypothetical protein
VERGETNEFSLPFRKTSMEDVLASFGVYNSRVRYARPASYDVGCHVEFAQAGQTAWKFLNARTEVPKAVGFGARSTHRTKKLQTRTNK